MNLFIFLYDFQLRKKRNGEAQTKKEDVAKTKIVQNKMVAFVGAQKVTSLKVS